MQTWFAKRFASALDRCPRRIPAASRRFVWLACLGPLVLIAFAPPGRTLQAEALNPRSTETAEIAVGVVQTTDTIPRWIAGTATATEVESPAEISRVARQLTSSKERTGSTARLLSGLLRHEGSGLYLHFDRSKRPFDIILAPLASTDAPGKVAMGAGDLTLRAGADATRPQGPLVAVFAISGGAQRQYGLRIPESVTRVTVTVDGQVVLADRPLKMTGQPIIFRVN